NGTFLKIQPPGILAVDKDGAGYPLTVAMSAGNAPVASGGLTLSVDPNGGFSASASCTPTAPATSCPYTFTYYAQNSQGTVSSGSATVTINFAPASGLAVTVLDGKDVLAASRSSIRSPERTTRRCATWATACAVLTPRVTASRRTCPVRSISIRPSATT